MDTRLSLNIRTGALGMAACIGVLAVCHLVVLFAHFFLGYPNNLLVNAFDLGYERSLPTLFIIAQWLCCLALLGLIVRLLRQRGEPARYWVGLFVLFTLLTIDEFLSVHERLSKAMQMTWETSGFLYFPWVIPYAILLVILGVLYLRFLLALPARTRRLFIRAFVVFIGGTIGLEILQAPHYEVHGKDALMCLFYITIEETLEMCGLTLFIYALADHLRHALHVDHLAIKLT